MAAVLSPSRELLLMRRADRPGDRWSGHISFPGGRVEPGDGDLLDTAIRETREEVGLSLDRAQRIGQLDDIAAYNRKKRTSGMVVRPFVFAIDVERPRLSLSDGEVASTRWVSLPWLMSGEGRDRMDLEHEGVALALPRVHFPEDWDGTALWGLTLWVIDDLLHRLDGRGVGLERNSRGGP